LSSTYNALTAAIANEENSTWPNNPGALKDSSGNKMTFPSLEAGYQALQDKVQYDASGQSTVYSPAMSLADFEKIYTGGDPNAANNIGSMLGVPTSTTLADLSDQALNFPSLTGTPTTSNPASQDSGTPSGVTPSTGGGMFAGLETWLVSSSANIVAVIIGLVLIAGAIFGLSQVRDTIISGAKFAA
jgi:hypothetical protein